MMQKEVKEKMPRMFEVPCVSRSHTNTQGAQPSNGTNPKRDLDYVSPVTLPVAAAHVGVPLHATCFEL